MRSHHPRRLVLFTTQRSGSTWLFDVLRYGGAKVYGELFRDGIEGDSPFVAHDRVRYAASDHRTTVRPLGVWRYLQYVYGDGAEPVVGVKLMYRQARMVPEALPVLRAMGARLVHLVRRNSLDVLVSEAVARQVGIWHTTTDEAQPASARVELPPDRLVDALRALDQRHVKARWALRALAFPHLTIYYEDLIEDESWFPRVFEYVGLPWLAEGLRSDLVRRAASSHREAIINYEEVRQILQAADLGHLLRGGA